MTLTLFVLLFGIALGDVEYEYLDEECDFECLKNLTAVQTVKIGKLERKLEKCNTESDKVNCPICINSVVSSKNNLVPDSEMSEKDLTPMGPTLGIFGEHQLVIFVTIICALLIIFCGCALCSSYFIQRKLHNQEIRLFAATHNRQVSKTADAETGMSFRHFYLTFLHF